MIFEKLEDKFQKIKRFRHIFLIISSIIGVLLFFFLLQISFVHLIYFPYYFVFIVITFILIVKISEVNEKKKGEIDKREFFKFIAIYLAIIIIYILFFSLLFFTTYKINSGYLVSDYGLDLSKRIKPLSDYRDFLFFSGITFVSYDTGIFPVELMKLFVFIELFISQIIILGFLFAIFGILIAKIKGKL